MSEDYRPSCVFRSDRPTNDELGALMAETIKRGSGASQQLFIAIAPLLGAFYEGQVQARRAKREDIEGLVQDAFMALYRRRASYDPQTPFRAWLIEIARSQLLDYLRSQGADSVADAVSGMPSPDHLEIARAV